ncbi:MAG: hydrolase TatD [Bacteroidetes bacterium RIFOXYA12_FULL_35_11]|nr:MAG: hydrolase TatD [Bacteroidetes bacterium GWF2_35_48]OFY74683.1 MAG: hydrolase TatD [Bacteroidetes bacterium RIFOXYA12_FULL_35_11]OFY95455.1 MAG: hydrolase TatD [Bacteroidetes bacterium RIFOXYB2_FULL_35_7]OFZ02224.1 MAG: hydrolase TatD [Bacteroidetes bacterium RIFOXYC12_FULL_35_7]HBX49910.1 hydrolase TatD [Bacteroidales bacterium]
MIDTHSHIYLEEFDSDREEMLLRTKNAGVEKIYLPNIDSNSIERMKALHAQHPDICPMMMGLHPGSVKENFKEELAIIEKELETPSQYCAIGEIGLDTYWDKTFIEQQKIVFTHQIELALALKLPIVIHVRNAFNETFEVLKQFTGNLPKGIFHCYSGNEEIAKKVILMGFKLGIGGVVTFNNSGLQKVVQACKTKDLVLETDAPFLAPSPYRGKRNEPAYLPFIAKKIAELQNISEKEVWGITTDAAEEIFGTQ